MTTPTIPTEAVDAVTEAETAIASMVETLPTSIDTDKDAKFVEKVMKSLRQQRLDLDNQRKALVAPFNAGVKAINDMFNTPINEIKEVEKSGKRLVVDYQDRLEAERRKAEAEAARLQAEAEKERLAEAERIMKLAEEEEAKGGMLAKAKAEALANEAEKTISTPVPVPVTAPTGHKINGTFARTSWEAVVVDATAVPREYLTPDIGKLNALARDSKGEAQIPGVRMQRKI